MSDALITPEVVAPVVEAPVHTEAPADPEWLPARLERAKKSVTNELLSTLGVTSLDEAKAAAQKAARFDEIEAANKTELQKAIDRADEAERKIAETEGRAAAAEVKALRTSIGTTKGIPVALIDMLTGTDEAGITAQADAILAALPKSPLPGAIHDVLNPPQEDPVRKAFLGK